MGMSGRAMIEALIQGVSAIPNAWRISARNG
jgi:hypothetical protein